MPIKPSPIPHWQRLAVLAAAALAQPALAQTDDTTPFYVGSSLGVSHVSNVYRQSDATNSDTVVSVGLLGGLDQRLGRQHVRLDGSVQDNRYSNNRDLNNQSYSLRAALDWQTVGHLSGTLSAKSDRSLADFNIGNGVSPLLKKNTERDDEYQALARLGVATRYTLEAGWLHRRRDFSAEEYDRFIFNQDTASLGIYATPAGNVKLGLAARHTKGQYPRYPVFLLGLQVGTTVNDYTRDDLDFTTRWTIGGHSVLNTRISRSRTNNSLDTLRDFSGTTGAIGWNWDATSKLQFNAQYARDTGQESTVLAADVNRVYTTWRLGGSYAMTSKLSLNASAGSRRSQRSTDSGAPLADAFEANKTYNVGLRWTVSRGLSLGCQYDRASRDSSIALYTYSASSYGCTGQAILY